MSDLMTIILIFGIPVGIVGICIGVVVCIERFGMKWQ